MILSRGVGIAACIAGGIPACLAVGGVLSQHALQQGGAWSGGGLIRGCLPGGDPPGWPLLRVVILLERILVSEMFHLIVWDMEKLDTEISRNNDGTADSIGKD